MSDSNKKQVVIENELIERARSGCRASMEWIVRTHQAEIRGFIVRKTGDLAVADDLAQEVFLAALTQISKLKESSRLRAWLFAVARNKVVDYLRQKSSKLTGHVAGIENILIDESIARSSNESPFEDELVINALRECIEKLSGGAKAIVSERYFAGQDSKQIAIQTNKAADAIRMSLMRIRKALASCIRRKLNNEVSL